jgi:hypothetical protein
MGSIGHGGIRGKQVDFPGSENTAAACLNSYVELLPPAVPLANGMQNASS